MEKRLFMPEISEEEFLEHIEDDEFFKVYGNPVIIRSKDGKHDCVFVSIEYYERIQRLRQKLEKKWTR